MINKDKILTILNENDEEGGVFNALWNNNR